MHAWWSLLIAAGLVGLALLKRGLRRGDLPRRRGTPVPVEPEALTAATATTFEQHVEERLGARRPRQQQAAGRTPEDGIEAQSDLTPEVLRSLEWKRFEQFVALYFSTTGVRAECTRIGADGGVDVYLYQRNADRPYAYVQCKAWNQRPIDVMLMRALRGSMADGGVSEGVFATTSGFTPDARAFAAQNGITVLDTTDLVERFGSLAQMDRQRILGTVMAGDFTTPSCPQCDTKMVWKESAGFWGCPRYPRCRSKPIYPRTSNLA